MAVRTHGYINGRRASELMHQVIAQHSLTAGHLFDTEPVQDNTRFLLSASCGHAHCYRVVTFGAVRRGFINFNDPLLCPAHNPARWSYSRWATIFYLCLISIGYNGIIVWDWYDTPENHRLHWDATVFLGGMAHRFEIDGPVHEIRGGNRPNADVRKDDIVRRNGAIGLLRLSYHDAHQWPLRIAQYIQGRLAGEMPGVWGTAWYLPFQGVNYGEVQIM